MSAEPQEVIREATRKAITDWFNDVVRKNVEELHDPLRRRSMLNELADVFLPRALEQMVSRIGEAEHRNALNANLAIEQLSERDDRITTLERELAEARDYGTLGARKLGDTITAQQREIEGLRERLERVEALPAQWEANDPPPPPGRYSASVSGAFAWCIDSLRQALNNQPNPDETPIDVESA